MVAYRAKLKFDWRSEKIIRASTIRAPESTLTIGTPSNGNTSSRFSTSVQPPESNLLTPKHEPEEQVTYEAIIPFEIGTIDKDEGNDEREHIDDGSEFASDIKMVDVVTTNGNGTIKPDLGAIIVVSGEVNDFFSIQWFFSSSN